ncbi:MAG TPA: TRCF domain-containing protein, partial [Baekduia sp.]|nr:TRCF domain-containing protein [Baekduia sp.]
GDEQSGHVAALGFELYMSMLDEAVAAKEGSVDGDEPEPVRLDVNVDAYVPADYVPYEQAKIEVHRRIAVAREVAELGALREELEDRFGEPPEPLENLLALQQARINFGRAGARVVSFRQGRLAVTPIDLDAEQTAALKDQLPGVVVEPGRSQVSLKVPDAAEERFAAVVRAADVLLAVVSAGAAGPTPEPVA